MKGGQWKADHFNIPSSYELLFLNMIVCRRLMEVTVALFIAIQENFEDKST